MQNQKKTYSSEELDSASAVSLETKEMPLSDAKYISTDYFNPVIWAQMKGMASTFVASRALPSHIHNVEQAIVQMQTGIEMGMKPMESIQSLYIVKGQVNIWGKATIKALRKHGWRVEYFEETVEQCSAKVTHIKTGEEYSDTFKFKDAEESGYTKDSKGYTKVGWKKGANRIQKLRYSVLSKIIKSYIPEVLEGVAEIQEVYEDYDIVEADVVEEKPENLGGKVKNVTITTPEEQQEILKDFVSD